MLKFWSINLVVIAARLNAITKTKEVIQIMEKETHPVAVIICT